MPDGADPRAASGVLRAWLGGGSDRHDRRASRASTRARWSMRRAPGRRHHHRPAAARLPRPDRLGAHRPVAGAADPGRVRRGLRRAGRARAGDRVSSARPAPSPTTRTTPIGEEVGRRLADGRLRGDHRRRPGRDGGGQQGRQRGRRRQRRPRHRAALRVRPQRVGRHRHQLPLLLRPQDDVREVLPGLRRAARRPRHPRRAVRGADAGADPEGDVVPDRADRHVDYWRGLLDWLRDTVLDRRQDHARPTSTCSRSPTTSTRRSR